VVVAGAAGTAEVRAARPERMMAVFMMAVVIEVV
jgi:hypothetical protein